MWFRSAKQDKGEDAVMLFAAMLISVSIGVMSTSFTKGVDLMLYANWLLLLAGLLVMVEQKKGG